jgi:ELWxxDGT repeat protein
MPDASHGESKTRTDELTKVFRFGDSMSDLTHALEIRFLLIASSSDLDVAVQKLPQGIDVAGTFYFAGPSTATDTLWRSDGTKAGTRPVSDGTTGLRVFSPSQFVNANGTLYFTGG